MNTDKFLLTNRENLLLMQVLCWLAPGVVIARKGVIALLIVGDIAPQRLGWLIVCAITVSVIFSFMFNNFILRYTRRIITFPERKKSLFAFLDLRGYILITCMIGLGIALKYIPSIPIDFFAGFYPGLGMALIIAGVRYFLAWLKEIVHHRE